MPARRPCAASSPRSRPTVPPAIRDRARPGRRLRSVTRAARRDVSSTAVHASSRPRAMDAAGFDWYDPVASHAVRLPGPPHPDGRRDWSFGRALWDVEPDPAALVRWCATESALRPGLPLWVVENGMCTLVRHGQAVARARRRGPSALRARAPRRSGAGRGRRAARHAPTSTGRWWTTTSGGPSSPASACSAWTAAIPKQPRWMDTDAQGDDAAGAFARALAGLRAANAA